MEQFAHPIRQFFAVSAKARSKNIPEPIIRMSEINHSFNGSMKSLKSAILMPIECNNASIQVNNSFIETNGYCASDSLQENLINLENENKMVKSQIHLDLGSMEMEHDLNQELQINSMDPNVLQQELDNLDFKKFVDDLSCNVLDHCNTTETKNHQFKSRIIYEKDSHKETIIIDSIPNKNSEEIHVVKVKITLPRGRSPTIEAQPLTNGTSTFKKIKMSALKAARSPRNYANSHHLPIMGKAALMNKHRLMNENAKSVNSDSEIVKELVTQRFQDYLLHYYEKSFHRQNSRLHREGPLDDEENERKQTTPISSTFNDEFHGISSIASETMSSSKEATLVSGSRTTSGCCGAASISGMSRLSDSIVSVHSQVTNEQSALENNMQFLVSTDDLNPETTIENNIDHSTFPRYEMNTLETNLFNAQIKRGATSRDDTVEYDATQFLKDALGDELNNYHSTDVSYMNSIGTSNISALVSKAGTNEYNTAIYEDTTVHTEYDYYPFNKRVGELLIQSDVQYQIISQTSKALSFCKNTKEFCASDEELEAERILLLATCKRDAIRDEIHRLEYEEILQSGDTNNYGSLKITQIILPPKQRSAFYSSKMFEKKKKRKFADWYLCMLTHGTDVYATSAIRADNDGFVRFQDEIIFDYLKADFEIQIALYSMRIRHRSKNMSHETKYHLEDDKHKLCPLSPPKIFNTHRQFKSVPLPVHTDQKSSYMLCGHFTLKINNIGHFGHFKFSHLNLSSLEGNFIMNFASVVRINENYSGFLDIGMEAGETIMWNRRWCTLSSAILTYFNYPGEENPLGFIDLHCCATAVIGTADRQICARPRTLLVEVFADVDNTCNKSNIIKYFLAADSKQYMDMWGDKLNGTINALRMWNAMK